MHFPAAAVEGSVDRGPLGILLLGFTTPMWVATLAVVLAAVVALQVPSGQDQPAAARHPVP